VLDLQYSGTETARLITSHKDRGLIAISEGNKILVVRSNELPEVI
jgi:hypothetical protein